MSDTDWLTLDEVSDLLFVPRETIKRWIYRKTNPLPSDMCQVDVGRPPVRVVKRSDALTYERPKMGGAREKIDDDWRDDLIRNLIAKQKEGAR